MIGDKLRRERERQGLTIKDVEQGTSIRALYIEAVENGDWNTLPGDVYTKGFVRNIASFLQLDADACVGEYVRDTGGDLPEVETEASSPDSADGGVSDEQLAESMRKRIEQKRNNQKKLMAAMLFVVVAGVAYLFATADDGKQATNVRPNENSPVVMEQKAPSSISAEETKPVAKTQNEKASTDKPASQPAVANNQNTTDKAKTTGASTAAKKANGVELTATFNDRCWMKVVADGATVYEGTMEKGNTMSWKGNERVAITAGNAGACEITYNGKAMGQVGAYGQVVNRTYTKENAN